MKVMVRSPPMMELDDDLNITARSVKGQVEGFRCHVGALPVIDAREAICRFFLISWKSKFLQGYWSNLKDDMDGYGRVWMTLLMGRP